MPTTTAPRAMSQAEVERAAATADLTFSAFTGGDFFENFRPIDGHANDLCEQWQSGGASLGLPTATAPNGAKIQGVVAEGSMVLLVSTPGQVHRADSAIWGFDPSTPNLAYYRSIAPAAMEALSQPGALAAAAAAAAMLEASELRAQVPAGQPSTPSPRI